jgi:acyl-CoA thioester hydrolase
MKRSEATAADPVGVTNHRVNYSEIDQMGIVYHARYLVWLDVARTEFLRQSGVSYRDLEEQGYRLVVSEANLKYRRSARYDDPVRIRTWVRDRASRRITFGYVVEHAETDEILVTATTALLVTDSSFAFSRLPAAVAATLVPTPDPVRL